jgi:hypothetical protein
MFKNKKKELPAVEEWKSKPSDVLHERLELIDGYFDDYPDAKGLVILIKPVRMKSGRVLCKSRTMFWMSDRDAVFFRELRRELCDNSKWYVYD